MNRIIVVALVVLTTMQGAFSQTLVSITPRNRVAVLEEFTGMHCGYCPDGHRLANALRAKYNNEPILINIHSGGYAVPSAGEPDYRTQFGDSLGLQAQVSGYPSGTVNRHLFKSIAATPALNRGQWDAAAAQIMKLSSPANVGVKSTFDSAQRLLTVDVEVFYTNDSAAATNLLNVVLLENDVVGVQSDYTNGNHTDYHHMHMLRWMLSGQWGELITTTSKGSLVKRTYTYTVPPAFNIANCEVAAFVAEGRNEIYSGAQVEADGGTTQQLCEMQTKDKVAMTVPKGTVTARYGAELRNLGTADERFVIRVTPHIPAGWDAALTIDGKAVGTDPVTVSALVPGALSMAITPGSVIGVGYVDVEVHSVRMPKSPVARQRFYAMSGVSNLLMSHPDGVKYDSVYLRAMNQANVANIGVMDRSVFEQFESAQALEGIMNLYYNVSWAFPGISETSMKGLSRLMDAGTNVFIAGQDFGWDLASLDSNANGNTTTKAFLQNYCMADFVADGSSTNSMLTPVSSEVLFKTVPASAISAPYGSSYLYPDEIKPRSGAKAIFTYNNSPNKVGGIRAEKNYKLVYLGVGLEQLTPATGDAIVVITRKWFDNEISSVEYDELLQQGATLTPNPAEESVRLMLGASVIGGRVRIVDSYGREVERREQQGEWNEVAIPVRALPSGVYSVIVESDGVARARAASFVVTH